MGIPANPPPQSRMPEKLLNDEELRPYFITLQGDLYRLWERSGGGTDQVSEITIDIEAIIARLNAIEGRLDDIEAELILINAKIVLIEARLDTLESRVNNSDHLIAGLIADNGKLRARINGQDRQIKNVNQLLAGLE